MKNTLQKSPSQKKNTFMINCIEIGTIILSITSVVLSGWLYKIEMSSLVRLAVLSLFFLIAINTSFRLELSQSEGKTPKYTFEKCLRFFIILVLITALTCVFPLFSKTSWIFPVLITALTLYSGPITGIISGGFLVMNAVMLSGESVEVFAFYLLVCVFSTLFFRDTDKKFKVFLPVVAVLSLHAVVLSAQIVFLVPVGNQTESIILAVINLFINSILYWLLLKIYSSMQVHRYRERYQTINDQEYEIMAKTKAESINTYYTAVHTAYFAERIADMIDADKLLAKGGSYYSDYTSDFPPIFPPPLCDLLNELKDENFTKKESAIVYLSKNVILSIMAYLKKNPKESPNYAEIVRSYFDEIKPEEIFGETPLTLSELAMIKEFFMNEKIYYDFLLRNTQ